MLNLQKASDEQQLVTTVGGPWPMKRESNLDLRLAFGSEIVEHDGYGNDWEETFGYSAVEVRAR